MTPTTVVNMRNEPFDVYIGRPSKWGNPFRIGQDGTREEVVEKFRQYIRTQDALILLAREELQGKRLGCYCKPAICHGDILAKIADGGEA